MAAEEKDGDQLVWKEETGGTNMLNILRVSINKLTKVNNINIK